MINDELEFEFNVPFPKAHVFRHVHAFFMQCEWECLFYEAIARSCLQWTIWAREIQAFS